jgi:hypothetical protein
MCVMGTLFLCETIAFARNTIATSIVVDNNENSLEPMIRINFNVTMQDLHCDFVQVDVWDALGTNKQNVTKNIDKWQIDENGVRRIFSGRNREVRALAHDEHDMSLEEMQEEAGGDGHVVDLTSENFDAFVQENEMAFVDMYAPW